MPCRRLTLDGHGQEFGPGREAVLCVVFHEHVFEQIGVQSEVALQKKHIRALKKKLFWHKGFFFFFLRHWTVLGCDIELTILLRRVLCMERLYII